MHNLIHKSIRNRIDWRTIKLQNASFIDDELRKTESDLLYLANLKNSETKMFLYILFEHFSSPTKMARFRLLKY